MCLYSKRTAVGIMKRKGKGKLRALKKKYFSSSALGEIKLSQDKKAESEPLGLYMFLVSKELVLSVTTWKFRTAAQKSWKSVDYA